MSLSVSVLPLRLTDPHQDFAGMVSEWMDRSSSSPSSIGGLGLRSQDCAEDLERISQLRYDLCQQIGDKNSHNVLVDKQNDVHAYYNYLLECEEKGLVGGSTGSCLALTWESSLLTGQMQTSYSLEAERANWIWNMSTSEAYQASNQSLDSKTGWSKAAQHLQNAASWLKQFPDTILDDEQHNISSKNNHHHQQPLHSQPLPTDFSRTFISFWQALLVAQSQRCVYESLACAARPRHLLVSKLAAAAVPLYTDVESILQKDDDSPAPVLTPVSTLVGSWADFAHAWGIYMSCRAEYHQSQLSREKRQRGQELARLHLSYHYAAMCNDFCERSPSIALKELYISVQDTLRELKERIDEAEEANQREHNLKVPAPQELTEIRGEKLVKIDQPLSKILKPKHTDPIFQNVTKGPDLRIYVELFDREMDRFLVEIAATAEDRTEEARKMLAEVNLPHSLTAYRQEQSGGGIPDEIWQRVETVQKEQRIARLKSDLWELRDVADLARTTFEKVHQQLDFDLESDRLFRQANPNFEGHDAEEVQMSFRQSLANYDELLVTANEGDSVLLKRLEQLDTNPKYKLLQFQKSQLDRLLPGAGNGPNSRRFIDTSHLSRLLVKLSGLFDERQSLLDAFREEVRNFDIISALQMHIDRSGSEGSDEDYLEAVRFIEQESFKALLLQVQRNLDNQATLVSAILSENNRFMSAREQSSNTQAGDSCIVMIEDAMEEIDQLSKHLKEGKDFYNIVIPKLEKLKQQVGDVSARLTVERLECDDRTNQAQQEEKDAMMAKEMSAAAAAAESNAPPGPSPTELSGVDDEKLAQLIAMDFDPAKAMESLKKHSNDVDQAVNELLSG
mmetsp:Transcript_52547/g.127279  ORF Transcript_52547/g.127279 Transcript_52547/m.127279 type:complete len:848 (+) Transcript_52547:270-2813(+)